MSTGRAIEDRAPSRRWGRVAWVLVPSFPSFHRPFPVHTDSLFRPDIPESTDAAGRKRRQDPAQQVQIFHYGRGVLSNFGGGAFGLCQIAHGDLLPPENQCLCEGCAKGPSPQSRVSNSGAIGKVLNSGT